MRRPANIVGRQDANTAPRRSVPARAYAADRATCTSVLHAAAATCSHTRASYGSPRSPPARPFPPLPPPPHPHRYRSARACVFAASRSAASVVAVAAPPKARWGTRILLLDGRTEWRRALHERVASYDMESSRPFGGVRRK